VFEAQEPDLLRRVAVKTPRSEEFVRPLLREARVLSLLSHPHIPPLYALRQGDDGPELVLPRLDGQRLDQVIADPRRAERVRRGESPTAFAVRVCLALCEALAHAHDQGVVHRDVKPSNVLLGDFGEVYLLDWGLAVSVDDDERSLPRASAVQGVVGTPLYLAPEQALEEPLSSATDQFALGCVLHEMLTGTRRNPGRSGVAILAAAQRPQPVDYAPEVDPDLAALANALTRADPLARPTAEQTRDVLVHWGERREARALLAEARQRLPLYRSARDAGESALALRLLAEIDATMQRALARSEGAVPPEAAALAAEVAREAGGVQKHLRQQRDQLASLAAIADRHDAVGRDPLFRALVGVLGGGVATALCLVSVAYDRLVSPVGYELLVPLSVAFAAMLVLATLVGSINTTAGGRRYARQYLVLSLMIPVHYGACAWLGVPLNEAIAWNLGISGTSLCMAGVAAGYLPNVLGGMAFLWGFVVAVLVPAAPLEVLSVTTGLAFGLFAASHALIPPTPEAP
jgi:hypothetical protein